MRTYDQAHQIHWKTFVWFPEGLRMNVVVGDKMEDAAQAPVCADFLHPGPMIVGVQCVELLIASISKAKLDTGRHTSCDSKEMRRVRARQNGHQCA